MPKLLFCPLPKAVAALLLLVVFVIAHISLPSRLYIPDYATGDFVQYWAAARVIDAGGDSYDPAQMLSAERAAGFTEPRPIMYWSPPWFIALAKPILSFDFPTAAAFWMRISTAFYLLSIWLGALASRRGPNAIGILALLLFAPFFDCLKWGQSSTLLALMIALLFLFGSLLRNSQSPNIRRGASFAVGAILPLLTIKPHLFLVLGIPALLLVKRWKVSFSASLLGLLASVIFIASISISLPRPTIDGWIDSLQLKETSSATNPLDSRSNWITPTFSGIARLALHEFDGATNNSTPPLWPSLIFPVIGAFLTYQLLRRAKQTISPTTFSLALLLSALFAPYGWHYDLVILAAPITALLCDSNKLSDGWAVILAILIGKVSMPNITAQHQFFWEALVLLLALLVTVVRGHTRNTT